MRVPTIKSRIQESPLNCTLADTSVSLRTANILEAAGILTVKDLLNTPKHRLFKIKNFGNKALNEILRALKDLGIKKNDAAAA